MPKKKVLSGYDDSSSPDVKYQEIALSDLSDVDDTDAPENNHVLIYNDTLNKYVPGPMSGGGGGGGLDNVVEDATPQLGGDLDVNGNKIVTTSNADIIFTPDGTGGFAIGNHTASTVLASSHLHIKDTDPKIYIQRDSNSDDSIVQFLGSAGFCGAELKYTGGGAGESPFVLSAFNSQALHPRLTLGEEFITLNPRPTGESSGLTAGAVKITGSADLRLYDASYYIGFKPAAGLASSTNYIFPSDGSSGQVLRTDGGGNLSWVDHCCPEAITNINTDTSGSPTGGGSVSWNSETDTLTFIPPDLSGYALDASLSAVASSGNYSDLTGTPSLSAVASSGNYSDLAGTPSIPTISSLGVDDLVSITGVSAGSSDLGSFTGSTITDNSTIKGALQELETEIEASATGVSQTGGHWDATYKYNDEKLMIEQSRSQVWGCTQNFKTGSPPQNVIPIHVDGSTTWSGGDFIELINTEPEINLVIKAYDSHPGLAAGASLQNKFVSATSALAPAGNEILLNSGKILKMVYDSSDSVFIFTIS